MKFEVEGASFSYKGGREVLKNICFSVESGKVLAILGPNGAGKTTLLRCAMGFLPWKCGSSTFNGTDIKKISVRDLGRKIAYVPQARSAITPYTVEETVLMGRSAYDGLLEKPKKEDIETAEEIISEMKLSDIRRKSCGEISGGELQMVLIARAMAAKPELLILDEPESNLDFRNQLLVLDTVTELAKGGTACIFNTHYPAHALRRADKALILGKSGNYEFGDTLNVVTEKNIEKYFNVSAVIGEVETDSNVYKDVVPVSVGEVGRENKNAVSVATVSVIMHDRKNAEAVNAAIHKFSHYLEGRMGMPLKDEELYIINIVIKARRTEIESLVGELSRIGDISVKATYAKEGLNG